MYIGNIEVYGVIYRIKNKINNKAYIGQTINGFNTRYIGKGKGIERVYNYHKGCIKYKGKCNYHLLKSIEKYGFDSFDVSEVFDVAFSKEELDIKEKIYINIYDCINNGYNVQEGGHDCGIAIGKNVWSNKYTEEQVAKVKELLVQGISTKEISDLTSVGIRNVHSIANLSIWKYVREDLNNELQKIKERRIMNKELDIKHYSIK